MTYIRGTEPFRKIGILRYLIYQMANTTADGEPMGTSTEQRTPLSSSAFHVLLALAGGPLHGYGVMQSVTDAGVKIGPGTIYGALHRMQEAGWVTPAGTEKARGPLKLRQRYDLTSAGRRVLREEARRVVHTADLVRMHAVLADDGETT